MVAAPPEQKNLRTRAGLIRIHLIRFRFGLFLLSFRSIAPDSGSTRSEVTEMKTGLVYFVVDSFETGLGVMNLR